MTTMVRLWPYTILCFYVHSIVKYLNRNVFIGQLLQHISLHFTIYRGVRTVKAKNDMLTKTYNKDICQAS